jgi:hypothetical protein
VVDDDGGVVAVGGHLGEAVPDDRRVAGHPVLGSTVVRAVAGGHRHQTWERPRSTCTCRAALDVGRIDPAALEDGGSPGFDVPGLGGRDTGHLLVGGQDGADGALVRRDDVGGQATGEGQELVVLERRG